MWGDFDKAVGALDEAKSESFKHKRHGIRFLFTLQDSRETHKASELGLFPTLMRGEFHGVRKTLEAFSKAGRLEQPTDGEGKQVCSLALQNTSGRQHALVARVRTRERMVSRYRIGLFE